MNLQDNGEFNIATSSLHALSNSMIISRAEKHSPHSSPRLSRRSTTPNVTTSSVAPVVPTSSSTASTPNDIYAAQQAILLPTAPSMHSINGSNQPTNCNVMKPASKQPTTSQSSSSSSSSSTSSSQLNSNRMSAPPMSSSSTQVINKVLNKALSADLNDIHGNANDQIAPPLPPRKSSPNVDSSVNRMLKPHSSINNVTSASSLVNLSTNTTISSSLSHSSENITFCEFDVPNSIAPPIPKHNVLPRPIVQTVASDLQVLSTTDDDMDKVIVGPAETITGIIDTRPLDARKPIILMSTTDKEQSTTNNDSNNLYHMKTSSSSSINNQPIHQRNQSDSNSNTTNTSITTSNTTSNAITNRPISTTTKSAPPPPQVCPETSSSSGGGGGGGGSAIPSNADGQPLLYENVTINHKDCNVPYENINLEYIARLMNEGYSKESVVTALGISRNNIEMACDILHEFVSKN